MCKHKHASLVQVEHQTEGMVLTYQCDDCDLHLWALPVPDGTFDAWMWGTLEVPNMDLEPEKAAIVRLVAEFVDELYPAEEQVNG